MAHILADRVRDTTTTNGVGAVTVSGTAPIRHRTFSAVATADGDTFPYVIVHRTANEWETGLATRVSANVYARTIIYAPNPGTPVDFSSGDKDMALVFTSNPTHANTIELGHPTDTTLARSAAGRVSVEGLDLLIGSDIAGKADLASPVFTGDPRAPTPATADNDTSVATTAFVKAQGYLVSSDITGKADLASPIFTGDPKAPTPTTADNDTSIATTAFVKAQGYLVSSDLTPYALDTDLANYQPLDAELTAVAGLSSNGLMARTGAGTAAARSIAGPAAGITVSNADGVSGNPTLALANDLAALEALAGTNTIYYRSGADAWSAVTIGGNMTFAGGVLNSTAGGGGAPTNAQYVVLALDATLTDERLLAWAGITRAAGFDTFVATPSSANLAALVTGETGTGALMFGTSPVITTDITIPNTGLHLFDTDASHDLIVKPGSNLTADRTFTVVTGDVDRTLTLTGNVTSNQDVSTTGTPTFASITLSNGQIVFPASQVASAGANTLDDYEEGTWTPTVTFATQGDRSIASPGIVGWYVKVGGMVMAGGQVSGTMNYTTSGGNIRLQTFPFTPSQTAIGTILNGGMTITGYTHVQLMLQGSNTYAEFYASDPANNKAITPCSVTNLPNGRAFDFRWTMTYRV
jgi:hypothetical protein